MEPLEHLRRAASFEASLAKLDPLEDGALYVVFLMRAGTNRVNAALHVMGVTGVEASVNRFGDLNHTYKPRLVGDLPVEVGRMFQSLSFIENLRPQYVRGNQPLTPDLVRECRQAYEEIVARTVPILESITQDAA
jgi:hypothetical protein